MSPPRRVRVLPDGSPSRLERVLLAAGLLYAKRLSWRIAHLTYASLFDRSAAAGPGRKRPVRELIAAIVDRKSTNPRFCCPGIAQQFSHTFGFATDQDVVRRVLAKHYQPAPLAEALG